ncbi:hypothetical protein J2W97_001193 [Paenibacillus jamilae]|nr:hypothetical protein [Paenibacillus jamilae]
MWTKGRKQTLAEEVIELLRDKGIDFSEEIIGNILLNKLTEREVEELRNVLYDVSK